MSKYELDEFDQLAQDRKVVGVHLRPVNKVRQAVTTLVALLVVALVAVGLVFAYDYFNSNGAKTPKTVVKTAAPLHSTSAPSASPAASPAASALAPAPAASASAPSSGAGSTTADGHSANNGAGQAGDANVNKALPVAVLNGTNITGWAGDKAGILKDAGYQTVSAGNYRANTPRNSAVFYAHSEQKATALDIAKHLGISPDAVIADDSGDTSEIVVVLRSDLSN